MSTTEITIGIICNIAASLIFLFIVLVALKPKIAISNVICKNTGYQIQIVNKSVFMSYDINAKLWICTKDAESQGGEIDKTFDSITLVVDSIFRIPPRPWLFGKEKTYVASRFRTHQDLNKILTEGNQSIIIMVSAKHGLSGLTEFFSKEYSDVKQIKDGKFASGDKINDVVSLL